MTREQLAHILRSAAQITQVSDVVVIGSQSILGTYAEDQLPAQAVASLEADLAFFDDDDNAKSDSVDAHIGEESRFHDTFGYYGQGVSISTAILPAGWRDRIVVLENGLTAPGRGLCLDRHDLVVSKLVAGRQKDFEFAWALIEAGWWMPKFSSSERRSWRQFPQSSAECTAGSTAASSSSRGGGTPIADRQQQIAAGRDLAHGHGVLCLEFVDIHRAE